MSLLLLYGPAGTQAQRLSPSFARMATLTASTKRSIVSGGKKPAPTAYLTGIKCTPFDPATADLVLLLGLEAAGYYLQTFVEGSYDIQAGDVLNVTSVDRGVATPLTIVGQDYPIKGYQPYQWRGTNSFVLVVEYIGQPTP
ncbi:MAG: hypothetical protein WCF84_02305 [Anaerolineae bacterium]